MSAFKVSMFEYCKTILEKISFSRKLFLKEYRKSLHYLNTNERTEFKRWVRMRFKKELSL